MKNNSDNDYVTVKVPKALAHQIDQLIEQGIMGYRSRAEMVNDAIRRRIEQLNSNNSIKPEKSKDE
jgi:metal-responsive CopG/Arc/MetJ family transcriptional regulator